MIETKRGKSGIRRDYEDYNEFLEMMLDTARLCNVGEMTEDKMKPLFSIKQFNDKSWDLGAGWDGAIEMATRSGWLDGLDQVRKLAESLESVIASKISVIEPWRDVAGMAVDVAAFLEGEPECFWNFEENEKENQGRIVKMGVSPCYLCNVPAHVFVRRGAVALALVDLLERAGYRVEVQVSMHGKAGNYALEDRFYLKQAGEIVDPGRMAFVLAHPAFFRRLGLRGIEQQERQRRESFGVMVESGHAGGYGRCSDSPLTSKECDIWIGQDLRFYSDKTAQNYIETELVRQGVELKKTA